MTDLVSDGTLSVMDVFCTILAQSLGSRGIELTEIDCERLRSRLPKVIDISKTGDPVWLVSLTIRDFLGKRADMLTDAAFQSAALSVIPYLAIVESINE